MKLFSKSNLLDEMQEQKLREIESKGFWGTWAALLGAFLIQCAMGGPASQWMGEWIIFMGMCFYGVIMCLVNGIWERHCIASTPANVVWSLAAAAAVAVYTWMQNHYLPGALITGVCTGLLCFVCLQAGVAIYKKRRHALDEGDEADEPEEEKKEET